MQKFLFFLGVTIFFYTTQAKAQSRFPYDAKWKEISELIEIKDLPQSALEKVNEVYEAAKKEKNEPQQMKALIWRINLQELRTEDKGAQSIQQLEEEIKQSKEPVKSILHSLTAEAYRQYFDQHRWKIYDRKNVSGSGKGSIDEWTAKDFHHIIHKNYEASTNAYEILKSIPVTQFDAFLLKGNKSELRPTLFDLLAHSAIDYYEQEERNISTEERFDLSTKGYWVSAEAFSKINILCESTDPSPLCVATILYQKLIALHLTDAKPDALIDIDLKRIKFLERFSGVQNKKEIYRSLLHQFISFYRSTADVSQAGYMLANSYAEEANEYNFKQHPLNDSSSPRWCYMKAYVICKQFTPLNTNSEGVANCKNLLQQIEQKKLHFETEEVNIPNQPFRALVHYRNLPQIWVRVIRVNDEIKSHFEDNYWSEEIWDKLSGYTPILSFSQQLPASKDFQPHQVEIAVPALPAGNYVLILSSNESFSTENNLMALQKVMISNIAWIRNGKKIFILNRETGTPLINAKVQVWKNNYNYEKGIYEMLKGNSYLSAIDGSVDLAVDSVSYSAEYLEIHYNNDQLMTGSALQLYTWNQNIAIEQTADTYKNVFFTDRAVYRPGQTVYFKGIILRNNPRSKSQEIAHERNIQVSLYNANGQVVESLKTRTNNFGSYAGKFIIPEGGLNGYYKLAAVDVEGETSFIVEEYKRPKFFVQVSPPSTSYKVNDNISVHGEVSAYAGFAISNASIHYRIVRKPNLPYPWLCYRWGWPFLNEKEISSGTTMTDKNGKFTIQFLALPDPSIRKELNPLFQYEITAEATDLNGETQSTTSFLQAGYQSIVLDMKTPGNGSIGTDSLKSIAISTQNMMNQFEPASTNLKIFRLRHPNQLLRKRYWQQPDQYILSEEVYRKQFPLDEYKDENEKENWNAETKVFEATAMSRADQNFELKKLRLQAGWYQAIATVTDKDGQKVQQSVYFEVRPNKEAPPIVPEWFWHAETVSVGKPGETIRFNIGSAAEDIYLIKSTRNTSVSQPVWGNMTLRKRAEDNIVFDKQTDKQYSVNYSFVRYNRFFHYSKFFEVKETGNELEIKIETFRDKTRPGAEEEWRIRIRDQKGQNKQAEILTSMYDASLDVFNKNEWIFPSAEKIELGNDEWQSGGFEDIDSDDKSFVNTDWHYSEKTYDQLPKLNLFYSPYRLKGEAAISADMTMAKETVAVADSSVKNEELPEIRKNFQETAFFYPQLQTDSTGSLTIKFKMPDAITRWNWRVLAHTAGLKSAYVQKEILSKKELMAEPYAPRFLREGDQFIFAVRITNASDRELSGPCRLELFQKGGAQSADGWFQNLFPVQYFTVDPGGSTVVKFPITVPFYFQDLLTYRVTAVSSDKGSASFSDGEQGIIPVLTDRLLLTETVPLYLKSGENKTIEWKKLLESKNSETIRHQSITAEFTTNPIWTVVQSLPYLSISSNESVETIWNRFYANAMASVIANRFPVIKNTIEKWKDQDSSAFLAQLDKNPELKALLLKESPWLTDAESETSQRKNIQILFDKSRIADEQTKALHAMILLQSSNGGFVWQPGGREDRYMTQYIMTGIGQLLKISAIDQKFQTTLMPVIENGLRYLDQQITKDYEILKTRKLNTNQYQPGVLEVEQLYMRTLFTNHKPDPKTNEALNFYYKRTKASWVKQSLYLRALTMMILERNGDQKTGKAIRKSLKEKAINHPEKGIFFTEGNDYYTYQTNEETQSLLIEAFSAYKEELAFVEGMKTWLLQQKRVQQWSNSKSTARACYALLQFGKSWQLQENHILVLMGNKTISSSDEPNQAGTGYFKKVFTGDMIESNWGRITLNTKGAKENGYPVWGGIYWQYTEKIDQIKSGSSTLSVSRQLFVEKVEDNKTKLIELSDSSAVAPGEKVIIRWMIKNDRLLEYVGLKDLRAACLEPVDKTSGYRWKDGVGFYESIRDTGTDLFFDVLPAGTFMIESSFYVSHGGSFSSGYASVQCLYAPEISAHSNGGKINVETP